MAIDWYKYLGAPHLLLYFEAFVIWVAGFLACAELSSKLFLEIYETDTSLNNQYLMVGLIVGFILGLLQAYFVFFRVCRRNLDRILELEKPLFFNCFRIAFYIFFGIFDTVMVLISNNYVKTNLARSIMGALDMSVSIGLFLSLWVYKEYWAQFRSLKSNAYFDSKSNSNLSQQQEALITDSA